MAKIRIQPQLNISRVIEAEPVFIKMAPMTFVKAAVPRNRLSVPISPVREPTGIEAFELPAGGKLQYLPVYKLLQSRVGSVDRVAIEFLHDPQADRWGLRVTLVKMPPDLLKQAAGSMNQIKHDVRLSLSYKLASDAATRRDHEFEDIEHDGATCTATLWAASIANRDAIYQALTTITSEAQLTAIRQLSVAIKTQSTTTGVAMLDNGTLVSRIATRAKPALSVAPQLRRAMLINPNSAISVKRRGQILTARNGAQKREALPKPRVVITGYRQVRSGGGKAIEVEFTIRNIEAFGAALFRRKRRIAGLGNKRPSRLLLEIFDPESNRLLLRDGMRVQGPPDATRRVTFIPVNGRLPKRVVFRLIDTVRNRRVLSEKIVLEKPRAEPPNLTPLPATYSVVDLSLPQVVKPEPFTFPADQHPHIYAALAVMPPVAVKGGLARHRESYGGRVHSYFQDVISPRTIYFLPDAFKIARHGGVLRTPQATVRVRNEGTDTDATEVTMDYLIAPYVDLARLSDAAEKIGDATGIDPARMEFQPYLTDDLSYTLSRPGVNGRVSEDRPTSPLMLQEPMVDTLVLPVADFQIAFDAMVGKTASVISGEIAFGIEGWGRESRSVTLDFKDLSGTALDVANISPTPSNNAATISLTNAIESDVAMNGVVVVAIRDGLTTPVGGLSALNNSGTVLTPGESETVSVAYDDLPGTGTVSFEVLKSGQVVPDADAIMNAILDRSSIEYFREIDVRTVPSIFPDPASNPPPEGIFALMVEFENGIAVVLDAANSQQTVRVDFPFADVILGHEADDGSYRFFRTIVRYDGTQDRDATANVSTSPVLFVTPAVNLPAPDDQGTG